MRYAAERIFWWLMWRGFGIYAFSARVIGDYDIPRMVGPYTMDEAEQIHKRLHS